MLLDILKWVFCAYLFAVVLWIFFLAVMRIIPVKDQMVPIVKYHAYAIAFIAFVLDVVFNIVVGTVLFLQLLKISEPTFSQRLEQYNKHDTGWRHNIAKWICTNVLDLFDPSGDHC